MVLLKCNKLLSYSVLYYVLNHSLKVFKLNSTNCRKGVL